MIGLLVQPHEDLPAFLPFEVGVADDVAVYVERLAADVADGGVVVDEEGVPVSVGRSPAAGAASLIDRS
jgi:hypothetical protein